MTTPTACPSVDLLKHFRLGLAPEAQVHSLEQHLSGCVSCLGRLGSLTPDDPLVKGLRDQRSRPRLNNPVLAQIQQELRAQPFRLPGGEHPTPAGQATYATVGESPPSDATVALGLGGLNALEMVHSFLAPPKAAGEIGWLGPFRVLKVLGEGGMGVVLLAEDTRLQRRVALKVMKQELASDPLARQRFLREARATAALEHEHIITIHHIDEANGVPYLAMPLLQGEPLEERLRREELLPVKEVLRIGRETALGLAAAHEKGLIHRDIKPGNLWLEAPAGRVKILDFGLAAMPCPEGEKTLPGTILGTPGYMAPEQTEGEADHRADLFSLGCLLYRMATGKMPFKGQTLVQKIRSTLFDTPVPPQQINSALPAPLCHLIQRLMARKPEDRPATALAVARVLETIESQLAHGITAPLAIRVAGLARAADATVPIARAAIPIAVSTLPPPVPRSRPSFNRRWLMIGGGSVAALVLLITVLVIASRKPSSSGGQASDNGDKINSEDTIVRRVVPPRKVFSETDTPVEATPDRSFPETWVLKPEPIEGLKGWSIESDGVGQGNYATRFEILSDDRLLIRYRPISIQDHFLWMQFEPKTCGLVPAPFGGSYDALSTDASTCARIVGGGVQLWDQEVPKERITLRSAGPHYIAAFSPDRKKIVTFDTNDVSYKSNFWDVGEGSKLGVCHHPDFWVRPATRAWSPDSSTLAVGAVVGVALFRAPWDKPPKTIARPAEPTALAWSPDGKYLATIEPDKQMHVIDVAEGKSITDIRDTNIVDIGVAPAWSPDGTELAFATENKKVIVWNLAKKRSTFTFTGHTRPIRAVAFLNDNKTLVSGSDGGVRFWDLENNRLRGTLLWLSGADWLAISPDGNYRCSKAAETRFVFKVREESNRLREFSPEKFRELYGWKNRPERVKLTPP